MGVSLGSITIKIDEDKDPVTVKGVHTFLTDINNDELYIIHTLYRDKETIQVISSSDVIQFTPMTIMDDDWISFYNIIYNFILIVLEKIILTRVFSNCIYYISDLMEYYLDMNQEVNEAKNYINII